MIFSFDNYRDFIRNYLSSLPKNGRGELSRLADYLGVNNTLLSQVLAGTRELSNEQAYALSKYWLFSEPETEYFLNLVLIERAGNKTYRDHLIEKRNKMATDANKLANRVQHQKRLTDEDRQIFYSNWLYSAIHLFTTLSEKGVTIEEICARFRISKNKVHTATKFLSEAGLIVGQDHRWKVAIQSTFVEQGSIHLLQHHRNWRLKAIEKTDEVSPEELMYTSQVSLSRSDFKKIRAQLVQLIASSAKTIADSPAEDLACFHIDWFWL